MRTPLRSPWRWTGVFLLLVTSGTHVPLIPEHLEEAPYVGWLFIALSLVSVVLAVLLVRWDTAAVWAVSGAVTALAVVAFLVSRTVGLPELADDIGNWTEPLGYPAVLAEMSASLVAGLVLLHRPRHRKDLA